MLRAMYQILLTRRVWRKRRLGQGVLFALAVWCGLSACGDLTGGQSLPAGTQDPAVYATPAGARGMRNAAVLAVEVALPQFITDVGLITDELEVRSLSAGAQIFSPLDLRILPEEDVNGGSYADLQKIRELTNQAIGALAAYDTVVTDTANARMMRGELYALQGYADIMLADLFCSGVPLSTLDFEHDYTLHAGSTTAEVYTDAIAKFDTALALAVDNDTITNLARVGRGRAWLDLGQFDSAAAATQGVPVDFTYQLSGLWYGACGIGAKGSDYSCQNILTYWGQVANRDGLNGLPYITSVDPRSMVDSVLLNGTKLPFPHKYLTSLSGTGMSPIVVASGIEAQLIRAEAQLQPADAPLGPWLHTLNTLRASAGLSDTTDPGTAAGRITLLFSERAYWLFLTGHRQGDLRRLLRTYGSYPEFQDQSQVYPTGIYPGSGLVTSLYGSDVTVAIPTREYTNPLYHGCLNRGA